MTAGQIVVRDGLQRLGGGLTGLGNAGIMMAKIDAEQK